MLVVVLLAVEAEGSAEVDALVAGGDAIVESE